MPLELLEAWERPVYGFVRRRLSDEHAAADVTQEVLLAIVRDRAGLSDPKRERAWVYGVARHALANHLRSRQRRDARLAHVAVPDPAPPSADLAEERDMAAATRRHLAELPQELREVLELTYFEELSQVEVAETLGLARATVRARQRRGLESLRSRLGAGAPALAVPELEALLAARPVPILPQVLAESLRAQVLSAELGSKTSVWILGGLTVKAKISIAAGACCVLAFLLLVSGAKDSETRARDRAAQRGVRRAQKTRSGDADDAPGRGAKPADRAGGASPDAPEGRPEASQARPQRAAPGLEVLPLGPAGAAAGQEEALAEAGPSERSGVASIPDGGLGGRVVDPQGQPIPGAAVELFLYDSSPEAFRALRRADPRPWSHTAPVKTGPKTTTDREGRFAFEAAERGAFTGLRVTGAGSFEDKDFASVAAPEGAHPGAALKVEDLVLRPVGALAVRVVSSSGAPVAAARVAVLIRAQNWKSAAPYYRSYLEHSGRLFQPGESQNLAGIPGTRKTGGDGGASFPKLPAGRYLVCADAEGARLAEPVVVTVELGETRDAELALRAGHRWTLRVTEANGRPIAGARVALEAGRDEVVWFTASELSDDLGAAVFEDLSEDRLEVLVQASGFATRSFRLDLDLRAAESSKALALSPACRLTGRVSVAASGRPAPGAALEAYPFRAYEPVADLEARVSGARQPFARGRCDARGAFVLDGLGPGRYRLRVSSPGLALHWRAVEVPEGRGSHDLGLVELEAGARLRARIRDGEGRPAAGLLAFDVRFDRLQNATHRESMNPGSRWKTDGEGVLEVGELEPGATRLALVKRGGVVAVLPITLRSGDNALELTLPEPAHVSGAVTREAGGSWRNTFVTLRHPVVDGFEITARLDRDEGRYRFEAVAAGAYRVYVHGANGDLVFVGLIDVPPGGRLSRDFVWPAGKR